MADLADLLLSIAREVNHRTRAPMDGDGATRTEITIMRFIDRNPGCSPSTLALRTGLQRSNVSAGLRALEAKGLVERVGDTTDGRATRLRSTPVAAANLAAIRTRWAALLRAALGEDGRAEGLNEAVALLARLDEGLAEQRSTALP